MLKTFKFGFIALKIAVAANGVYAIVNLLSQIYENTLFPLLQIFLLSKLLDIFITQPNLVLNDFYGIAGVYVVASIIRSYFKYLNSKKEMVSQMKLFDYLDLITQKKLSQLDPAVFEKHEFQDLLSQMNDIRQNVGEFLNRFTTLIDRIVKTITASIVLSGHFAYFIPIIAISVIPGFLITYRYRTKIFPATYEERNLLGRISNYIRSLLSQDSASKEIAIFKNGEELSSKISRLRNNYTSILQQQINSNNRYAFLTELFQLVFFLFTQFINLSSVITRQITIGQFSLYFQQTLTLINGIDGILDHYSGSYMRVKWMEKYEEFMNYPRTIDSPEKPVRISVDPTPPVIELKNISFRYPGTDRDILKDFNLTIDSGEKVALVGENGAGKTTLIKLLLRFYDPTEGEVLVNGINLKELDLERWHEMTGALFQDFVKYQFTLKENVYFGDLKKKDELHLIKKALESSGAKGYLKDLPKGIDQNVGKMFKDGIDLSGGQWQKLALARAFFRDAPILILDEPTSAIDAKAEYEIFQKVQKLQSDKTVIIISHRFSTVRNADRILVLDKGKIKEQGNHEELMKTKGLYHELFTIQAKGYK